MWCVKKKKKKEEDNAWARLQETGVGKPKEQGYLAVVFFFMLVWSLKPCAETGRANKRLGEVQRSETLILGEC